MLPMQYINAIMPHCLEFAMASPSQAVSLKSAITSQLQYRVNATMPCCLEFAMASPLQAVSLKFAIKTPLQYCDQCHTATLPHRHAGISSENPTDQRIHHIVRLPTLLSDNPSKDTEPIADQ
jgi:hypothetical protein